MADDPFNDQSDVSVLVVDDSHINCLMLSDQLEERGYSVTIAHDGELAMELLRSRRFDMLLLDILMPRMNGYEVLERMKRDRILRHIPVIMISAVEEFESVIKCIKMGAEDYLPKPINSVLLDARIGACLEKKWLRDQERANLNKLKKEQERSEYLLLNILPESIAERLKRNATTIADYFEDATVMFTDIVDFSIMAGTLPPSELVEFLNEIFSAFDELALKYGLEKIKTIGDAYMVAGGIPIPDPLHAEKIAEMALDMREASRQFTRNDGEPISMRIGISTGPLQAGVIGIRKFSYDLWGETVNAASRMEKYGLPDTILVTESTYQRISGKFIFKKRNIIDVKGMGKLATYFLVDRK